MSPSTPAQDHTETAATDNPVAGYIGQSAGSNQPLYPADHQFTRADLASALTAAGFPIKKSTLAGMACRGGGPPYSLLGGYRVMYEWGPALSWASARKSPAFRTASEHAHAAGISAARSKPKPY